MIACYATGDVTLEIDSQRDLSGGGNGAPRPEHSAEDEANDIVGFFQSKLE